MNERDLFVDDVRVLPNKALRINIPCDIARNFNEAMYFIEFQEYDFVSLDYSMDGETGLDVLKLMKQLKLMKNIYHGIKILSLKVFQFV